MFELPSKDPNGPLYGSLSAVARERFRKQFRGKRPQNVADLLSRSVEILFHDFKKQTPLACYQLQFNSPNRMGAPSEIIFERELSREEAENTIAREYGFTDWDAAHVEPCSIDMEFENAVDAIVTGDLRTLRRLLKNRPELAQLRSSFGHSATLLHYVSGCGVETRRQCVSKNVVAIAELLITAGTSLQSEAHLLINSQIKSPLEWLMFTPLAFPKETLSECVRLFVENKAIEQTHEKRSVVYAIAAIKPSPPLIDILSENGFRLDNLVFAAAAGDVQSVRELLNGYRPETSLQSYPYPLLPLGNRINEAFSAAQSCASMHQRGDVTDYLLQLRSQISICLDEFDDGWQLSNPADLPQVVPDTIQGPLRKQTLADLVAIDMDYRWQSTSSEPHTGAAVDEFGFPLRPLVKDYQQVIEELAKPDQLPVTLISEQFRLQTELDKGPELAEAREQFGECGLSDLKLENLLREAAAEHELLGNLRQLTIICEGQAALTMPMHDHLILGRQEKHEPEPYSIVEQIGQRKLVIAPRSERFVSRKYLELRMLPNGRLQVTNLSQKNGVLLTYEFAQLQPMETREMKLPATLEILKKWRILIEMR